MGFDNARPIYQQIIDEYKKQLVRGELRSGDKIVSQREYAEKARVNPNTVQRAYREMEMMGMVETVRGQGTFIIASELMQQQIKEEMADQLLRYFVAEMRSLGYDDNEIRVLLEQKQEQFKGDRCDD